MVDPAIETKNVLVVVVLNVKPDTTLVSAIKRMLSSLVTFQQLKRNLYLPSYHWKYKVLSFGHTWTVAQAETLLSRDAVERLQLTPSSHESHHIVTVNGVKKQSLPLYEVTMKALNGTEQEKIEITGSNMADFTVVKRPKVKD